MIEHKECTYCGQVKPISDFHLKRKNRPERRSQCAQCLTSKYYQKKGTAPPADAPEGLKLCKKCNEYKEPKQFYLSETGGYKSPCLSCRSKKSAEWRKNNALRRKLLHINRTYGLSTDNFYLLLSVQKGKCGVCGVRNAEYVDHDHRTNKVRGLLCQFCNFCLGHVKDNEKTLENLIRYLHNPLDIPLWTATKEDKLTSKSIFTTKFTSYLDLDREVKLCPICRCIKSFSVFGCYPNGKIKSYCNECTVKKNFTDRLVDVFGITTSTYFWILQKQDARCVSCSSKDNLCIDHCHIKDTIRGILCSSCNSALGYAQDSASILQSAIDYLQKHRPPVV